MNAKPELSNADRIRKIAEQALQDALQIMHLIELLRAHNSRGINSRISKAGGSQAVVAFRNAMIGHLTLLVARAYANPRPRDLHCRVAADLLKSDKTSREIFEAGDGGKLLAQFQSHWEKCVKDPRLERIEHFRHKYTAHLGEPKDIPEPEYRELFAFGIATAQALDLLALTTKVAVRSATGNNGALFAAEAFWKP
jgi:hypothetical protein